MGTSDERIRVIQGRHVEQVVNDYYDQGVLSEISLLGDVLAAVAELDRPLSLQEVDEVLALTEPTEKERVAATG